MKLTHTEKGSGREGGRRRGSGKGRGKATKQRVKNIISRLGKELKNAAWGRDETKDDSGDKADKENENRKKCAPKIYVCHEKYLCTDQVHEQRDCSLLVEMAVRGEREGERGRKRVG